MIKDILSKNDVTRLISYFFNRIEQIKSSCLKRKVHYQYLDKLCHSLHDWKIMTENIDLKEKQRLEWLLVNKFLNLPNILDDSVTSEDIEIFSSQKIKNICYDSRVEIAKETLATNIESFFSQKLGSKISGNKYLYYTKSGFEIFQILYQLYSLNAKQFGFSEVKVPTLINKNTIFNSSHNNFFFDDMFSVDNLWLSPTSETQLLSLYANNKIQNTERLSCFSTCFRKEAGSYGKKNILFSRLHEFHKMELFVLCDPKQISVEWHNLYIAIKTLLEDLQLSFRILRNSYQNTSPQASLTYDFEIFVDYYGFLEVSSLSNTLDFQTVRANIKNTQNTLLYSLNGTALSMERVLLALFLKYGDKTKDFLYNVLKNKISKTKHE